MFFHASKPLPNQFNNGILSVFHAMPFKSDENMTNESTFADERKKWSNSFSKTSAKPPPPHDFRKKWFNSSDRDASSLIYKNKNIAVGNSSLNTATNNQQISFKATINDLQTQRQAIWRMRNR